MDNIKGKIYLIVFVLAAFILGMGVWNNYRPQIIYASCADIAEKTTNIAQRKDIMKVDEDKTFDVALNECLSESGYYEEN